MYSCFNEDRRRSRRRTHKILVSAMAVFLLMFIALVGRVIVWFALPANPMRIDSFKIDRAEVKQGEKICFLFQGEKFLALPVKVTVEMVNGEGIEVMSYTSNNPVGTLFKKRCFIVPYSAEPGKYFLRWTGTWPVNPIQSVTKVVRSDDSFTVGLSAGKEDIQSLKAEIAKIKNVQRERIRMSETMSKEVKGLVDKDKKSFWNRY